MAAAATAAAVAVAAVSRPTLAFKPIYSLISLPLPSKPPPFRPISLSAKARPFLAARASGWARQEVEEEEAAAEAAGEDFDWDGPEPGPAAELSEWEGAPEESGGEEEVAGEAVEEEYAEPPEEAKLFVGNLPYDVDSQWLAELFEKAGTVEIAEVIYNRDTDQSRGFGFITMSTVEEAEKAIGLFHRYDIKGRLLTVNKASPRGARVDRPPRAYEPSFRIYVGNLAWQVDDARLEQLFSEHGKVVDARVVYDRDSGRSRGFGFVTMASQTELDDAIAALDGQSLDGRPIRVNVAEDRPRRGGF